ncbi:hypothetical protein DDZ13_09605 [Coraliomargarita sinensis]|uniref:DUF4268 domain-containing protein n=1 Tax=Coraliomargarita sinensis TaxID=2174842 RepID=A0A317ZEL5_9BACT|nr:DUF4268 domain-containing protein [Coraliomargarita sinensis]PXA03885.1 hypothetical protein DDZ13_09605 [Coraliomargarita sinensis]
MFQINATSNEIVQLVPKRFSDLGFTERGHLQEWIAKMPESLGEELLIIQKEFDGFDETRERLDLLALDKQGDLVVIENKLDDSGRDVVWQALKYASYCSSLSKSQIAEIYQAYLDQNGEEGNARERIVEFLGASDFDEVLINEGVGQRLIFVSANFRREVTSTAMWLLENQIRLQCFKATPYQQGNQLFLTLDQIIPTPEEAEFRVGISEKKKEQKTAAKSQAVSLELRPRFWTRTLEAMEAAGVQRYATVSPSKDHWLSCGSGLGGVIYSLIFSKKEIRVEIYMSANDAATNKAVFDQFYENKEAIENRFGHKLEWQRLDDKKASRVKYSLAVDGYDEENWEMMIDWLVEHFPKLEKAFRPEIEKVKRSR